MNQPLYTTRKAIGRIEWKDDSGKKHWADFYASEDAWGLANNLPHEIEFNNTGSIRAAKVLNTVVHIAIDEAADRTAVMAKWNCKSTFY